MIRFLASIVALIALALLATGSNAIAASQDPLVELHPTGRAAGDQVGTSMALDGEWLVAGARGEDDAGTNVGAVHVWQRTPVGWVEHATLMPSDAPANAWFGNGVAIDGSTIVIGAPLAQGHRGAAYVFVWDGLAWTEQGKLSSPTPAPSDFFGWSVDVQDDRVLVGAIGDDSAGLNRGAAYVFDRTGATWSLTAELLADAAPVGASGGYGVALDVSRAVVGHPTPSGFGGNAPGQVMIFDESAGWAETALTSPSPFVGDNFGVAVAADPGIILVGASGTAASAGAAHLFATDGSGWVATDAFAPSSTAGARVGYAVDIAGTTIAIGGFGNNAAGLANAGGAWQFDRSGGAWAEAATHQGSVTGDYFGRSVAADGGAIAIGAPLRDLGVSNGGAVFAPDVDACDVETTVSGLPIIEVDEFIDDDGTVTPFRCSIREAIQIANNFGTTITVEVPAGNYTIDHGTIAVTGTVALKGTSSTAQDVIIDANLASGHFVVTGLADVRFEQLTLTGGSGMTGGAVLATDNASVTFFEMVFDNNHSPGHGGALAVNLNAEMTVDRSTLSNNSAALGGGAIDHSGAPLLLIANSTITGNVAGDIGTILTRGSGDIDIFNSTIVGNAAHKHAGIAPINGSSVTVTNSIVAANSANLGSHDCDAAVVSEGYNVLGHCSGIELMEDESVGIVAMTDLVEPLSWGNARTPTMRPVEGSPALSNGSGCLPFDQIGAVRTSSCDSGARER